MGQRGPTRSVSGGQGLGGFAEGVQLWQSPEGLLQRVVRFLREVERTDLAVNWMSGRNRGCLQGFLLEWPVLEALGCFHFFLSVAINNAAMNMLEYKSVTASLYTSSE